MQQTGAGAIPLLLNRAASPILVPSLFSLVCSFGSGFGAGLSFSLVTSLSAGTASAPAKLVSDALFTGLVFGGFQALFYNVGQGFLSPFLGSRRNADFRGYLWLLAAVWQ